MRFLLMSYLSLLHQGLQDYMYKLVHNKNVLDATIPYDAEPGEYLIYAAYQ